MPIDTLQSTKLLPIIDKSVDRETFEFFKSVINDIQNLRLNLLGINRDAIGGLTIHNQPIASAVGDQLVLEMDKSGSIAIKEDQPNFGYANLHVGGPKHIFGFPARCAFRKSADIAGLGNYGWDTALYNNEPDMFRTSFNGVASGQIDITCEGTYRIVAQIRAENAAATATVVRMIIADLLTGVGRVTISSVGPYAPAGINNFHTLFEEVTFNSGGGNIVVDLTTGVTRLGTGVPGSTRIYVTRVN